MIDGQLSNSRAAMDACERTAGPPILSTLRDALLHESPLDLPDRPMVCPEHIRMAHGALDGIITHHMVSDARKQADFVDRVMGALLRLIHNNDDEARASFYSLALGEHVVAYADAVVDRLQAQTRIGPTDVRPHARWLVQNARHREPLKLGMVLLGATVIPEDLEDLMVLARHDEFALYAAIAVCNLLEHPGDMLWAMAKRLHGWGRIHVVERLAQCADDRRDIQEWLLRQGWRNEVMSQYLACACATGGDLRGALAAESVDDELLDAACEMLTAMLTDGPSDDIDHYTDGAPALAHLLRHLRQRRLGRVRLGAVTALQEWLDWPPPTPARVGHCCDTPREPRGPAAGSQAHWRRRAAAGWTESRRAKWSARCRRILEASSHSR